MNVAAEILRLEPKGAVVEVKATVTLEALEQYLLPKDLTLGPLSPDVWALELRAFLEGAHAGLRAVPGGRLEPVSMALTAELPGGGVYRSTESPRRAAGPDLDALFLGGEGRAGSLRSVTLRLFPRPEHSAWFRLRSDAPSKGVPLLVSALSMGIWIWEAALSRVGKSSVMELNVRGSHAAVDRDREALKRLAERAGLSFELFRPGSDSSDSLAKSTAVARAPMVRELSFEQVRAAAERGEPLTLHRLALSSVLDSRGEARLDDAAAKGDTSALLEAVTERLRIHDAERLRDKVQP